MSAPLDLDALVVAARSGSVVALDALMEALSECLMKEFAERGRSRHLSPSRSPADIIQDTLVRVRLSFERFKMETFDALRGWARGIYFKRGQEIARNSQCHNAPERKERIWRAIQQRIDSLRDGDDAAEALIWQEDAARVYALYETMGVEQKTLIELRLFEGLSYAHISEITRLKPDAARMAYERAIAKLAELFQSDGRP